MNKKSKLKKVTIGAVTATVIASTLATSIPFNVLTAKASETTETSTTKTNQLGALQATSENVLKNTEFNGFDQWYLTFPYTSITHDGWYCTQVSGAYVNSSVKPFGDGQLGLWAVTDVGNRGELNQDVKTIPGHRYRFTASVSNESNGLYAVSASSGSRKVYDSGWRAAPANAEATITADSENTTITLSGFGTKQTRVGYVIFSNVKLVDLDANNVAINPLDTTSTVASGKANPLATVNITVNGNVIGTGKADSNGNYSITIPKQGKGTVVVATDPGTGTSASTTVTQGTIRQTTIRELTTTSQTVSGTAEPYASMLVRNGAGTLIASGQADGNGAYSFTIPVQRFDDTITATATVDSQTSTASTKVKDGSTPNRPTLNPVSDTDTTVTGTGAPGNTIRVTIGGNTYTGLVDQNGSYAVVIPKQNGGTNIAVVQVNPNNQNVSPQATVTVSDMTLAKPVISAIAAGDTKVTVTGVPNALITLITPDGEETAKAADATGKATFNVYSAPAGSTYRATQKGANGKASPVATAVVAAPVVTTGTITTKDFTLGKDRNIEGTYTGDVKSFRITIDGTVYTGGTINASAKTYAFYALDKITKTGTFRVEGLDASGKVLDTKTGTIVSNNTPNIPGTGTVVANSFTIHQDINVTGTVTGDVKSLGLLYDGTEYRGGTVNSNGTFSFYALNTIKDKTKSAVMYGYDKNGNRIATSAITLFDAQDPGSIGTGTVSANNFVLGVDRNITGSYTGDVKSLGATINGVEYRGGTLNKDGTFNFYAVDKIKNTTDSVVVNGYDKEGNRIATSAISVTNINSSGTITPNTYTIPTDRTLTATYTGDVKSVKVTINGTDYVGGTVSGGQVSFYVGDKIKSASDIVKITAYDMSGQMLDQKPVAIASASATTKGTVTPNRFTAGRDTTLTGTYTDDVKAVKVSINGTIYSGGTVAGGTISFYIGNKITSSSDDVKLYGYDAFGKQLDVKSVDIANVSGDIQPDVFTVPSDSTLTANVSSAVSSVRVTINGTNYSGGTITSGRLSFWIGDKIKSTSDTVAVTALDRNGVVLDTKPVTIRTAQPAVGTITPATFSLKSSSVTGTYTGEGKSIRLTVNGTVLPAGGNVTGGNFSYYVGINNRITSTSDNVKIELLDRNGLIMDTKSVTVTN
ncbi:hypothetical protein X560_1301 [Listeria fleischmannii 1991]|uniref:Cell wall-associated protease n=2 Tax=Listeria fleischmannii TaxID=1069827 RepID=A0A2X3GGB0_9LIST|nr:immunoglobulin-like domain-containing protein [Listeria fleischmannii]EMG28649.1 cell wall-associated (serine) protease [Listeria fleischmannii subsp. fleischmannii LU2006-1]KMT59617.1 hypothetical protein X560_1301 [Listeria fleischmannii 1991]SQC67442.1 Uncharacterised protein [Listeria fleischmannii subsp. fleischmannii]